MLEVFKHLESDGFKVTYLRVDDRGYVNIEDFKSALTPETILVSMMYVNNEVGSVLPIQEVAEILSSRQHTLFHVDAVQAFGKIDLIPNLKGIDLLSMSSHKIHGPKGVGALFIRDKVRIAPLFQGGGQEKGIRSGTENLPGIVGFGVATEEAFDKDLSNMRKLKDKLVKEILNQIPDTVLNSPSSMSAPHIANISFLGTRGEILLHSLEARRIYVSTGSACSSHKVGDSHVLQAMGKSHEEIEGAVRFSLSTYITEEDIDYTVETLKKEVKNIRKVPPEVIMENLYLVSFGEIALKGENRPFFERILIQRIKRALSRFPSSRIQKTHGRILLFCRWPGRRSGICSAEGLRHSSY